MPNSVEGLGAATLRRQRSVDLARTEQSGRGGGHPARRRWGWAFRARIRWLGWGAIALVAATGAFWVLRGTPVTVRLGQGNGSQEAGVIPVLGLQSALEVKRDQLGVPHLKGRSEHDLWFGLGFVHAQDRLAQLLWMRRMAQGTTAEVIGGSGLPGDRLARTLGIGLLAARASQALGPEARAVLQAYGAGINASMRHRHDRASEALQFKRDERQARPARWEVSDSIAILKLLSWAMSNGIETGLVLDDLIAQLGGRWALPFRPDPPAWRIRDGDGNALPSLEGWMHARGGGASGMGFSSGRDWVRSVDLQGGSAWVLGGHYTESGSPFLVADLHLPVTAPSLMYAASLSGESMDLAGATIPGVPVFWFGRNSKMAWAALPARAVTVDLFTETVRWADGTYRSGGLWTPLDLREENIEVRTEAGLESVPWIVRSTRHGPLIDSLLAADGVLSEPIRDVERRPLSLAWTGAIEGDGFESLLRLARAGSEADLLRALPDHHEPVISVVYADQSGRAGMQLAGWLPERILPTSLVPVPGRLALFDWVKPIPFSEMPHLSFDASRQVGPQGRAFLALADGAVGSAPMEAPIEWMWRSRSTQTRLQAILQQLIAQDPARQSRPSGLVDLLSAWTTLDDMGGHAARDFVPAIVDLANQADNLRPEAKEILSILADWDGVFSVKSRGAAIYQVLMHHLLERVLRPSIGPKLLSRYLDLPDVKPNAVLGQMMIAAQQVNSGEDPAGTEPMANAVASALRQTWVTLSHRLGVSREDWRWGALHQLRFIRFEGARSELVSEIPPIQMGGSGRTLAYASFDAGRSFAVDQVSNLRIAIDLAYPDRLLLSLAPGQSESSEHVHYQDALQRWTVGKPFVLETKPLWVEGQASSRLLLEPVQ